MEHDTLMWETVAALGRLPDLVFWVTSVAVEHLQREPRCREVSVYEAGDERVRIELRRLEAEGLVESEEAPAARGHEHPYSITDAGCDELLSWLGTVEEPARERDAALIKATYFEYGSFDLASAGRREGVRH
jgi:DNA-binding PadR family transcriptional regulator